MHGDHIFGLFGLISTFNLLNRKNDLNIYAYHEIEKILESHIAYFERNMSYKIVYHNINPKKNELIFENDKLTVHTIPLKHKVPTCGFLFREKEHLRNLRKNVVETYQIPIKQIQLIKEGNDFINDDGELIPNEKLTLPPYKIRSYAYCTDTAYSEKIVPIIENVDLLFHEATLAKNLQKQAKETTHSTSTDAATIAKKANVKKLIIGHFSARYKDVSLLLQQAQEIFPNTFAAEDGEKYSIELSR